MRWRTGLVLLATSVAALVSPAGASTLTLTGNRAAISYLEESVTAMARLTHAVSVSSGGTYLGVESVGGQVLFNLDYLTTRPSSRSEVPVDVTQYVSASGNVIHWDLTVLASPCGPARLTCASRVDRLVILDLRGAHYWALESNAHTPAWGSALLPSCWYRSTGATAGLVTDFSSVGQLVGTLNSAGGAGETLDVQPRRLSGALMVVPARVTSASATETLVTWIARSTHRWARVVGTVDNVGGTGRSVTRSTVYHYATAALRQPAATVCRG